MNYIQFYTATIFQWKHLLNNELNKTIILDSLRYLVNAGKIKLYAYVIMPNHIHVIWKIEEKISASRGHVPLTTSKWERNPLSVDLYTREVVEQKLDYIHNNPKVEKWKLVMDDEYYKYSSEEFYETEIDKLGILTHYLDDL